MFHTETKSYSFKKYLANEIAISGNLLHFGAGN
jgi:hypothetical protein